MRVLMADDGVFVMVILHLMVEHVDIAAMDETLGISNEQLVTPLLGPAWSPNQPTTELSSLPLHL